MALVLVATIFTFLAVITAIALGGHTSAIAPTAAAAQLKAHAHFFHVMPNRAITKHQCDVSIQSTPQLLLRPDIVEPGC